MGDGAAGTSRVEPTEYRALFGHHDFVVLLVAAAQSQIGDQLARVALSVLIFTRTGSGLATATTYALTYLPAVLGGVLLTSLADRHPRRSLLVVCDVIRAVLFGAMAIPALPLGVVGALLVAAVLAGSPYNAAEPAVVADIFSGPQYVAALGLRTATSQASQLAGFALGGVLVAAAGARSALAVDAATFAASAALLRVGLTYRSAAAAGNSSGVEQLFTGLRTVAGDPRLRSLLALAWSAAFWIVPEGLAVPYAAEHGGGPLAVGALLAANPTGNLIGVIVLTRWVPNGYHARLLSVLAIVSGVPLILCGWGPGIVSAAALWGICGLCSAYFVLIVTEFVAIVPPAVRGQAIGVAGSGLLAAQGIGLLVGGVLASVWTVDTAIAVCGATGLLLAVVLTLVRQRVLASPLTPP